MVRQFFRRKKVEELIGLGRSQIYDLLSAQEFPPPIPVADRAVAWIDAEIAVWQEYKIAKAEGYAGSFIQFVHDLTKQQRDDAIMIKGMLSRFAAHAAKPKTAPKKRKAATAEASAETLPT